MILIFLCLVVSAHSLNVTSETSKYCGDNRTFPDGFIFGAATAAFQIEGAWNEEGRTESIWDVLTHNSPGMDNADVACDSYHNVLRDIRMIEHLGLGSYRFSMSWTRVLPKGYPNEVNPQGLAYYNLLIDELIKRNITPVVTIYHWDLPQRFQLMGGFLSNSISDWLTDYADVLFTYFGDRVKIWVTLNEPSHICHGYSGSNFAPRLNDSAAAYYVCVKNALMAHARIYKLYNEKYRTEQGGKIGFALETVHAEPYSSSDEDKQAAQDMFLWSTGIFAEPVFGSNGDFPEVVKQRVLKKSLEQGYTKSRLPTLTQDEIDFIKGTCDYYGMNTYTTKLARRATGKNVAPSAADDQATEEFTVPYSAEENSQAFTVVPWGFYKLLVKIMDTYSNPDIYILENGYSSQKVLNDDGRVEFLRQYLNSLMDALDAGVNVKAYHYWSLLDNFEWGVGYSQNFGLFQVDFEDPLRTRSKRLSADVYKKIVQDRAIDMCYEPVVSDERF